MQSRTRYLHRVHVQRCLIDHGSSEPNGRGAGPKPLWGHEKVQEEALQDGALAAGRVQTPRLPARPARLPALIMAGAARTRPVRLGPLSSPAWVGALPSSTLAQAAPSQP